MSISKIRENARAALTGKWGKGACITLAYFAISFLAIKILQRFSFNKIIQRMSHLTNGRKYACFKLFFGSTPRQNE